MPSKFVFICPQNIISCLVFSSDGKEKTHAASYITFRRVNHF